MVGRIIRHAAMMRIFYEPEPGIVKHTKASRMLARPDVRDWMRAGIEELGPAGGKVRQSTHLSRRETLIIFLLACGCP